MAMTSVLASPHVMTAAAVDIAEIRAALNQAELAELGPTAGVAVAAADGVSAAIAESFSTYASGYRALSQNAAAFHDAFAQALKAASDSYSRAEAAAAASLAALTQSAETLLAPLPGNATAAT